MSLNSGMKRLFLNILKSTAIIAMTSLLGWYTYQSFGIIGVATNAVFFAMGALWIATWDRPKNKSETNLEIQSLNVTNGVAPVAGNTDNADKLDDSSESRFPE